MQDVKELLYSVIDEVGKQKIRCDLNANIAEASAKYCSEIVATCTKRLGNEANAENLGVMCDALLHFMLTAVMLPSERKVFVDTVEYSVIVPSVKMLKKNPEKALVIQVIKNEDADLKIRQAEAIQPHKENIWLVSPYGIATTYKNYKLQGAGLQYTSLLADIQKFISEKGVSGLKLMHG